MDYKELKQLSDFCLKYQASVVRLKDRFLAEDTSFPEIHFSILDKQFNLFVDDEFDDLKVNSNPLSVCIALRALESYDFAEDYLVWCTQHNFDAADMQVRDHFQNLGEIVAWFAKNQIQVDSFISDFDFELNAGVAQFLRFNPDYKV